MGVQFETNITKAISIKNFTEAMCIESMLVTLPKDRGDEFTKHWFVSVCLSVCLSVCPSVSVGLSGYLVVCLKICSYLGFTYYPISPIIFLLQ